MMVGQYGEYTRGLAPLFVTPMMLTIVYISMAYESH